VRTDRRRPPPVPPAIYIPNDLGFCPGSAPTRHHWDAGHGYLRPRAGTAVSVDACLYYAYLRPSEAIMLKEADCRLPGRAWGRIDLALSAAQVGKDWTDHGVARQQRGLKHRPQHETRSTPIPPILVQMLRDHLKRYGTAPDGPIFLTTRRLIQDSANSAVWQEARAAALPPPSKPPRSSGGPATCGTRACRRH